MARGASSSWFLVVFDAEEDVEEVCGNQDKVETKDCRPANLCRRRGGLLASRVTKRRKGTCRGFSAPGFSCEPQSASLLRGHKSGMHPEQST